MGDADKYLHELDGIVGKKTFSNSTLGRFRDRYKEARSQRYSDQVDRAEKYMDMDPEDLQKHELQVRAYARALMEDRGDSTGPSFYGPLRGAKLYERIGKGKKIIPKLLAIASSMSKSDKGRIEVKKHYDEIKVFIERNQGERKRPEGGLEDRSRMVLFIGSFLAGIALSVFSLKSTGNVIGSLTGTTPGLLGIFLFVFGIAGLVFSGKK